MKYKKYKRRLNPNLIKTGQSYTVQDISDLYSLHKNSVQRWFRHYGLVGFEHGNRYFAHANDLKAFIVNRNNAGKVTCKDNEIYCMKCRKAVEPFGGLVDVVYISEKRINLKGICPKCDSTIYKVGSLKKLEKYKEIFTTQTIPPKRLIDTCISSVSDNKKEVTSND